MEHQTRRYEFIIYNRSGNWQATWYRCCQAASLVNRRFWYLVMRTWDLEMPYPLSRWQWIDFPSGCLSLAPLVTHTAPLLPHRHLKTNKNIKVLIKLVLNWNSFFSKTVYMYIYMYTYTCTYTYTYSNSCTYTYTYIYIYMTFIGT